jgi:predicted nucleic acid-binding protein
MAGILFDTSVYIQALRSGDSAILTLRRAARAGEAKSRPLYLSVVVLEELFVGASSARDRKLLSAFEKDFAKINRLTVPQKADWILAGQVLNKIGGKYGFDLVARARLTNDALIALSSASRGLTVITRNAADYALINEFRPFSFEVI